MALSFGKMLKPFFKLSPATFQDIVTARYGAQEDIDRVWLGFEPVPRTLIDGFMWTLDDCRFEVLVPKLNAVEIELRGLAYEGAGMGLMLLDSLGPWKNRMQAFLDGPGAPYLCLVYIGAGLVLPRMPRNPLRFLKRLDPFYCWMAIDGYGFYEGFFSGRRSLEEKRIPSRLSGYALRAFDHGLGRSLWFATGANTERIHAAITAFPEHRQGDLWSGIGLACAYAAGVVDRETIQALREAAGAYQPQMAVGAAIAAKFRQQASSSAPHTELSCDVLWGAPGETVARFTDTARQNVSETSSEPAYEIWRQRIAEQFTRLTASGYQKEAR
ncbi:MAG TPA: DUF1702 family protein [Ktedonobacteraceae bacterium]|jgi:hypothetical protein